MLFRSHNLTWQQIHRPVKFGQYAQRLRRLIQRLVFLAQRQCRTLTCYLQFLPRLQIQQQACRQFRTQPQALTGNRCQRLSGTDRLTRQCMQLGYLSRSRSQQPVMGSLFCTSGQLSQGSRAKPCSSQLSAGSLQPDAGIVIFMLGQLQPTGRNNAVCKQLLVTLQERSILLLFCSG